MPNPCVCPTSASPPPSSRNQLDDGTLLKIQASLESLLSRLDQQDERIARFEAANAETCSVRSTLEEANAEMRSVQDRLSALETTSAITVRLEERMAMLEASHAERSHYPGELQGGHDKGGNHAPASSMVNLEQALQEPAEELTRQMLLEDLDMEGGHLLQSKFWDTALFIGTDAVGCLASVYMVLILSLNVLAQVLFLVLMLTSEHSFLGQAPASEPELASWRASVGHSLQRVLNGASLVSRICGGDGALEVGGAQRSIVAEAETYLDDSVGLELGPLLCMLCLLLWMFAILAHLSGTGSFVLSLLELRAGRTRVWRECDGTYAIDSISTIRLLVLMLLSLTRFSLATGLLVVGSFWLSETTSVLGLLYNVVSMAFVLNLDTTLFKGLCPDTVKVLVAKTKALPSPTQKRFLGLGKPFVYFLASATLILGLRLTTVEEKREMLLRLSDTLCGGDQNFAYDVHGASRFLRISGTTPWRPATEGQFPDQLHMVHQHIWRQPGGASEAFMIAGGLDNLQRVAGLSSTEAASGYSCEDQGLHGAARRHLELLRLVTQSAAGEQCSDFAPHCDDAGADALRTLCPSTCGCSSPRSGLETRRGCPASCVNSDPYRSELLAMSCSDMPAAEAAQHPGWLRLGKRHAVADCGAVTPTLCLAPTVALNGTYRFFCPTSCGCFGGAAECPPSCA